jgi:hypothetical protein
VAALPWYGRDWIASEATHQDILPGQREALTGLAGYRELIGLYHAKPSWDSEGGEYSFKYVRDGKEHTVWMPEHEKFDWMVEQVLKAGAAGIYVWHIAYTDPESWNVLRRRLKAPATPVPGRDLAYHAGPGPLSFSYSASGGTASLGEGSFDAGKAHEISFRARLPEGVKFTVALEEGVQRGGDAERVPAWRAARLVPGARERGGDDCRDTHRQRPLCFGEDGGEDRPRDQESAGGEGLDRRGIRRRAGRPGRDRENTEGLG